MIKAPGKPARRGVTAVEFALVAPALFLFVLAGIEFSRMNLIVHTTKVAAVEGARQGIVPGASADDCRQEALAELALVSINNANITVSPDPITRADDNVSVKIAVPATVSNGFAFTRFFAGRTLEYTVTLSRETAAFAPASSGGG